MLDSAAEKGAKMAVEQLKQLNLENGIPSNIDTVPCLEGEPNMASNMNKTYTYLDDDQSIKTIRFFGKSKKELDLKFQHFLSSQKVEDVPTVKEFVESTYIPMFLSTLRPTTAENYKSYLKLNILPFMGDLPMNQVRIDTIQGFVNWMATAKERGRKKNLNEPTITRVLGLVKRIFNIAFEMKIVDDIPVKNTLVKINAEKGTHHIPLTDEEIRKIRMQIPELKNKEERLYMALLAFTGMRTEEIMGLRWEDYNQDGKYLLVKRAVTYPKRNMPHIDETKTIHSERTVAVVSLLAKVLDSLKRDSGFILGGDSPLTCTVKDNMFKRAKLHLNIVGYSSHDFRATYGTQLRENGVSSIEGAGLMGHADSRMFDRVYARTRHDGIMKQAKTLEQIMCLNAPKTSCP